MADTDEKAIRGLYERLTRTLIEGQRTITTMESCTAGLIASLLTDTEGSSAILKGAFVTYSNEAKIRQGVDPQVIEHYGVYSQETARAMAAACRSAYQAMIGIGITGTFGNADPANADSVPGVIYYAMEGPWGMISERVQLPLSGSRYDSKMAAAGIVGQALAALLAADRGF